MSGTDDVAGPGFGPQEYVVVAGLASLAAGALWLGRRVLVALGGVAL